MWIILLEVHYCTVEQVSHLLAQKARSQEENSTNKTKRGGKNS